MAKGSLYTYGSDGRAKLRDAWKWTKRGWHGFAVASLLGTACYTLPVESLPLLKDKLIVHKIFNGYRNLVSDVLLGVKAGPDKPQAPAPETKAAP